jgi:hypothetical protein
MGSHAVHKMWVKTIIEVLEVITNHTLRQQYRHTLIAYIVYVVAV